MSPRSEASLQLQPGGWRWKHANVTQQQLWCDKWIQLSLNSMSHFSQRIIVSYHICSHGAPKFFHCYHSAQTQCDPLTLINMQTHTLMTWRFGSFTVAQWAPAALLLSLVFYGRFYYFLAAVTIISIMRSIKYQCNSRVTTGGWGASSGLDSKQGKAGDAVALRPKPLRKEGTNKKNLYQASTNRKHLEERNHGSTKTKVFNYQTRSVWTACSLWAKQKHLRLQPDTGSLTTAMTISCCN